MKEDIEMKKTISIFLLMCFSLSLMGMASAETGSNEATIKGQILAYTEDKCFEEGNTDISTPISAITEIAEKVWIPGTDITRLS